eukprot:289147_1
MSFMDNIDWSHEYKLRKSLARLSRLELAKVCKSKGVPVYGNKKQQIHGLLKFAKERPEMSQKSKKKNISHKSHKSHVSQKSKKNNKKNNKKVKKHNKNKSKVIAKTKKKG